jgi:hypothetical protein
LIILHISFLIFPRGCRAGQCAIHPTKKDISFIVPFSSLITLGPPLPKRLYDLSMLEIHGDAFVFGGCCTYNSAIYQLTCSSGICSWSTLNQELKLARESTVAIPVPDTFCV